MAVVDGQVSGTDDLPVTDDLLNLQDQLTVKGLRDSDHLGVSLVCIRVQLKHGAVPAGIVNSSVSNLTSHGGPSGDTAIDIVPSRTYRGAAEITIKDKICAVVGRGELDIIDGQTVRIAEGGSVEVKDVFSRVECNGIGSVADTSTVSLSIVEGVKNEVVPDDVAHRGIKRSRAISGSHSPIEFEFVGEGRTGEGVVAGSNVAVSDLLKLVVESEILGDFIVLVTVKLANLTNSAAVSVRTVSNLDSSSLPSTNIVEDSPRAVNVGAGEVSIDDNIVSGSLSDKLNVVDQKAI